MDRIISVSHNERGDATVPRSTQKKPHCIFMKTNFYEFRLCLYFPRSHAQHQQPGVCVTS